MIGLEELLANRWILKSEEKEKYYLIRDNIEEIRKYITEKLGCQLIVNSHLIKMEKIPAQGEGYMGITAFSDKMEYCFLCLILMFLEDKEPQEQFVLSQMTEYIAAHMAQERVDWTVFSLRKHLIKVMRFCIDNKMIRVTDGDSDNFAQDDTTEVLYENTGISKYFMKNFTRDIMHYEKASEFEQSDWVDVNEDRGIARRHRIYKRLLFSPGIYKNNNEDEDFEYLKYYGNRLMEDFEKNLNCRLQVYKNSAYLIMNEDCRMGNAFPANHSLSDIVLLCNHFFADKIKKRELDLDLNECVVMDIVEFEKMLLECRALYVGGLVKTYRDKTSTEFVRIVSEYMEQVGFIRKNVLLHQVHLLPIMGKIMGDYPKNFDAKEKDE